MLLQYIFVALVILACVVYVLKNLISAVKNKETHCNCGCQSCKKRKNTCLNNYK